MKTKTIEKVLSKKINEWVETITDPKVKHLATRNTIVTGGAIASMLLNEPVNDYDIYFRNRETVRAVAEYYAKQHKEFVEVDATEFNRIQIYFKQEDAFYSVTGEGSLMAEPDDLASSGLNMYGDINEARVAVAPNSYTALFFTPNAITLSDNIQLVLRFYGEPKELHKNYDYVHATNYYDNYTGEVVTSKGALESLLTKELRYIGSLYPLTSIIRSKKFIKRGWSITAGEYLKMMFQVAELDLTDPEVLKEQLTSVDIAYFSIVIEALNNRDVVRHPKITYPYICEVIDRVFN